MVQITVEFDGVSAGHREHERFNMKNDAEGVESESTSNEELVSKPANCVQAVKILLQALRHSISRLQGDADAEGGGIAMAYLRGRWIFSTAMGTAAASSPIPGLLRAQRLTGMSTRINQDNGGD